MRGARRLAGFTLIELLLALALTGIVALLFLAGTRFSAMGLERVAASADKVEARRSLDELLRREIAGTLASPLVDGVAPLEGSADAVSLLTLDETNGAGLYRVRLAAEAQGGARALVLTRKRFDAADGAPPQRIVLVPRLQSFTLAYFGASGGDDPTWQVIWKGSREPPRLIRVTLDLGDGLAHPPIVVRLWSAP